MANTQIEQKNAFKELYDFNITHDLYKNMLLDEYIYLDPIDLNNKINDIILAKLKHKVENRCHKYGYIIKNSVKIQTRSLGMINNASFDGKTTYKVKYTADVCNPVIGQIIQCQVKNIDKSEVMCYIDTPETSPIEIYLFKQNHVDNAEFMKLKLDDVINVKIAGSKWEHNSKQIMSIAKLV